MNNNMNENTKATNSTENTNAVLETQGMNNEAMFKNNVSLDEMEAVENAGGTTTPETGDTKERKHFYDMLKDHLEARKYTKYHKYNRKIPMASYYGEIDNYDNVCVTISHYDSREETLELSGVSISKTIHDSIIQQLLNIEKLAVIMTNITQAIGDALIKHGIDFDPSRDVIVKNILSNGLCSLDFPEITFIVGNDVNVVINVTNTEIKITIGFAECYVIIRQITNSSSVISIYGHPNNANDGVGFLTILIAETMYRIFDIDPKRAHSLESFKNDLRNMNENNE